MWQSREILFGLDHPTAAGHFPGNPIIPGAVLLDEVLQAIAVAVGTADEIVIPSVKFLHLVRPGAAMQIRWRHRADGQTDFECRTLAPERLAVVGTMQVRRGAG